MFIIVFPMVLTPRFPMEKTMATTGPMNLARHTRLNLDGFDTGVGTGLDFEARLVLGVFPMFINMHT
jgi:hypothetical protein